jgi:hypothetical protein
VGGERWPMGLGEREGNGEEGRTGEVERERE